MFCDIVFGIKDKFHNWNGKIKNLKPRSKYSITISHTQDLGVTYSYQETANVFSDKNILKLTFKNKTDEFFILAPIIMFLYFYPITQIAS